MENLALWVGIVSILVALFAVIILYLTRKNILDILDKDVVLFDKNFEIKKQAIDTSLSLIDDIEEFGTAIKSNSDFNKKAKDCYNDLLCVTSDVRVADEFYNLAIDKTVEITETRLAQYKLSCRTDIGLRTKKAKVVKRTIQHENKTSHSTNSSFDNLNNNFSNQQIFNQNILETKKAGRPGKSE